MNRIRSSIKNCILIVSAFITLIGCTSVYTLPGNNFLADKEQHFAILPFEISFEYKNITEAKSLKYYRDIEKEEGYALQKKLYSSLNNNSLPSSIKIQNIDETNSLLLKKGISVKNIWKCSKKELVELCGVDALIIGTGNFSLLSAEKDLAANIFRLTSFMPLLIMDYYKITPFPISLIALPFIATINFAVPSYLSINLAILDKDNELKFRFQKVKTHGSMRNYKTFSDRALQKAVSKFPFKN